MLVRKQQKVSTRLQRMQGAGVIQQRLLAQVMKDETQMAGRWKIYKFTSQSDAIAMVLLEDLQRTNQNRYVANETQDALPAPVLEPF